MSQNLEKRITAALASDATSADVATMIAEVDVALPTAIDAAERERIKAYDPTVDAQKALQSLADAEFARDLAGCIGRAPTAAAGAAGAGIFGAVAWPVRTS